MCWVLEIYHCKKEVGCCKDLSKEKVGEFGKIDSDATCLVRELDLCLRL